MRNLPESRVREFYRKWDNVKMIDYDSSKDLQAKKAYGKGFWGFNIKVKERLQSGGADPVSFAVVVTLKELEGKNRMSEFVKRCQLQGWLVHEIDIEQQVEVFIDAEEEIEFE